MRKELFLSCSILAIAAGNAGAGDLYVSVLAGVNTTKDQHRSFQTSGTMGPYTVVVTTDTDSHLSDGYILGGTVGARLDKWLEGLRVETEVSYRHNRLKGDWQFGIDGNFPTTTLPTSDLSAAGTSKGELSRFAVMANVWYDVDVGSKIVPYVGGGAGWNRVRLKLDGDVTDPGLFMTDIDAREISASGFAWQLGAGANYEVSPGVKVGLGYRYFRGAEIDRAFGAKNSAPGAADGTNHSVEASVAIDLN